MSDPTPLFRPGFPVPQFDNDEGLVLIHGLQGYLDAGHAVQLATQYLLESNESELVGEFDADQLVDHRSRRPVISFGDNHFMEYHPPKIRLWALRDSNEQSFLLLEGEEPDTGWERFTSAMVGIAKSFHVTSAVGLYGIPMTVPHTRDLPIKIHTTSPEQVQEYDPWDGPMRFSAGADIVLQYRLSQEGIATFGLTVFVPNYLVASDYPAAALRLLTATEEITGLKFPTLALERDSQAMLQQVREQVIESPEIAELVSSMEQRYDSFVEDAEERRSLFLGEGGKLPTGDEIGEEFERFLAEHDENGNPKK